MEMMSLTAKEFEIIRFTKAYVALCICYFRMYFAGELLEAAELQ